VLNVIEDQDLNAQNIPSSQVLAHSALETVGITLSIDADIGIMTNSNKDELRETIQMFVVTHSGGILVLSDITEVNLVNPLTRRVRNQLTGKVTHRWRRSTGASAVIEFGQGVTSNTIIATIRALNSALTSAGGRLEVAVAVGGEIVKKYVLSVSAIINEAPTATQALAAVVAVHEEHISDLVTQVSEASGFDPTETVDILEAVKSLTIVEETGDQETVTLGMTAIKNAAQILADVVSKGSLNRTSADSFCDAVSNILTSFNAVAVDDVQPIDGSATLATATEGAATVSADNSAETTRLERTQQAKDAAENLETALSSFTDSLAVAMVEEGGSNTVTSQSADGKIYLAAGLCDSLKDSIVIVVGNTTFTTPGSWCNPDQRRGQRSSSSSDTYKAYTLGESPYIWAQENDGENSVTGKISALDLGTVEGANAGSGRRRRFVKREVSNEEQCVVIMIPAAEDEMVTKGNGPTLYNVSPETPVQITFEVDRAKNGGGTKHMHIVTQTVAATGIERLEVSVSLNAHSVVGGGGETMRWDVRGVHSSTERKQNRAAVDLYSLQFVPNATAGDTCTWSDPGDFYARDNSCPRNPTFANDGSCDEPDFCEYGSDCSDCGNCEERLGTEVSVPAKQVSADGEGTMSYTVHLKSSRPVQVTVDLLFPSCKYFDKTVEMWKNTGCVPMTTSTEANLMCACNHLTSFGGRSRGPAFVKPNVITVATIAWGDIMSNPIVFYILCSVYAIFLLGFVWAKQKDLKMALVAPPSTPIHVFSFNPNHGGRYRVSVKTGIRPSAGLTTGARAVIQLFGERGSTAEIQLGHPTQTVFARNSICVFIVSSPLNIGAIDRIRIRHDGGKSGLAHWYVDRVEITTLRHISEAGASLKKVKVEDATREFWVGNWLGINVGDGLIQREVKGISQEESKTLNHAFTLRFAAKLAEEHTILAIFLNPPGDSYTKTERMMTLMLYIFATIFANAFFYQGGSSLTVVQMLTTSLQSAAIATPLPIISAFLFKYEPPLQKQYRLSGLQRSVIDRPRSRKKEALSAIGWILSVGAIGWTSYYVLVLGIEWGPKLSQMWAAAIAMSIVQSTVVITPLWIMFSSFIIAVIWRSVSRLSTIAKKRSVHTLAIPGAITTTNPNGPDFLDDAWHDYRRSAEDALPMGARTIPGLTPVLKSIAKHDAEMTSITKKIGIFLLIYCMMLGGIFGARTPGAKNSFVASIGTSLKLTEFEESVKDPASFWEWAAVLGTFRNDAAAAAAAEANATGTASYLREQPLLVSPSMYILGPGRIRQLKVTDHSCKLPTLVQNMTNTCYAAWSVDAASQPDYAVNVGVTADSEHERVDRHWGWMQAVPYKGRGFGKLLPTRNDASAALMANLSQSLWISSATRIVLIEMTFYNPAVDLVATISLNVEMPPAGGAWTSYTVSVHNIDKYLGDNGIKMLVLESALILVTLIYGYRGIQHHKKNVKLRGSHPAAISDCVFVCGIVIRAGVDFGYHLRLASSFENYHASTQPELHFDEFERLRPFGTAAVYVDGVMIFLGTIRILLLLRSSSFVESLFMACYLVVGRAVGIVAYFAIIVLGYASLGFVLYGKDRAEFATIYDAAGALAGGMTERSFVDEMHSRSAFFAVYYTVYQLGMICAVFTLFATLLLESMSTAKKQGVRGLDLVGFWTAQVRSMFGLPDTRLHASEKQGGDGINLTPIERLLSTMDEIDNNLESALSKSTKSALSKKPNRKKQKPTSLKKEKKDLYCVSGRLSANQYVKLRKTQKPPVNARWAQDFKERQLAELARNRRNAVPVFLPTEEDMKGWETQQRISIVDRQKLFTLADDAHKAAHKATQLAEQAEKLKRKHVREDVRQRMGNSRVFTSVPENDWRTFLQPPAKLFKKKASIVEEVSKEKLKQMKWMQQNLKRVHKLAAPRSVVPQLPFKIPKFKAKRAPKYTVDGTLLSANQAVDEPRTRSENESDPPVLRVSMPEVPKTVAEVNALKAKAKAKADAAAEARFSLRMSNSFTTLPSIAKETVDVGDQGNVPLPTWQSSIFSGLAPESSSNSTLDGRSKARKKAAFKPALRLQQTTSIDTSDKNAGRSVELFDDGEQLTYAGMRQIEASFRQMQLQKEKVKPRAFNNVLFKRRLANSSSANSVFDEEIAEHFEKTRHSNTDTSASTSAPPTMLLVDHEDGGGASRPHRNESVELFDD